MNKQRRRAIDDLIERLSTHSALARGLALKRVVMSHEEAMAFHNGETGSHEMRSPHPGHLVAVYFGESAARPDLIRIRSTNWRCEHEPGGYVTREEARCIWTLLKRAGMIGRSADERLQERLEQLVADGRPADGAAAREAAAASEAGAEAEGEPFQHDGRWFVEGPGTSHDTLLGPFETEAKAAERAGWIDDVMARQERRVAC